MKSKLGLLLLSSSLHQFANSGAKAKESAMLPGESAGGHFDPKKAKKHARPNGGGTRIACGMTQHGEK